MARRSPVRTTQHARPTADDLPVVGAREPCPCGSGRRYKACHGRASGAAAPVLRPFAGRVDEPEWVALREVVPAATAPLRLTGELADREVTLATVLPAGWAAMVRGDGAVFVGVQVPARSGDISRDIAAALLAAVDAAPGTSIPATGVPGGGPRLQDVLDPGPLEISLRAGFDYWVEGVDDPSGEVAAAMESANAGIVPTVRVEGVPAAYLAGIRDHVHLRWVLPDDEEPALDAMARMSAAGGLAVVPESRYLGCFRAHGLLVPVWELAGGTEAGAVTEPVHAWRARLDEELAAPRALTGDERRARAELLSRQVTLR